MTQPPEYPQNEEWNLRLQKIRARFDFCLLYKNLCAEHIVSYDFTNVNRDFRLQIGIFNYKTGKLITKRDFYNTCIVSQLRRMHILSILQMQVAF